jgi:L-amino acid N-acyltransferase
MSRTKRTGINQFEADDEAITKTPTKQPMVDRRPTQRRLDDDCAGDRHDHPRDHRLCLGNPAPDMVVDMTEKADATLRPATEADLPAINDIYNHYVRTSTCTYQETDETMEDRVAWFKHHGPAHPIIVAEIDGVVVGWGSLSPFRERSGYRFTVEDSVYIDHEHHNRGIGSTILQELIKLARQHGYKMLIAGVDGEQLPSVRLHSKFGFVECAHFKRVGFKFDRWLDVIFLQLSL